MDRNGDVFRNIGTGLSQDIKDEACRVKMGKDKMCAVLDIPSHHDKQVKVGCFECLEFILRCVLL